MHVKSTICLGALPPTLSSRPEQNDPEDRSEEWRDLVFYSQIIRGVPSEVVLHEEDGMKSPCAVNLHNAVTVSQQRLGRRVA